MEDQVIQDGYWEAYDLMRETSKDPRRIQLVERHETLDEAQAASAAAPDSRFVLELDGARRIAHRLTRFKCWRCGSVVSRA